MGNLLETGEVKEVEQTTTKPEEKTLEEKRKELELANFNVNEARKDEEILHAIKLKEAEVVVLKRRGPLMKRLVELGEEAQEKRLELPHCEYIYKKNMDDKKKGDTCMEEPTHGKLCLTHHKMELRRLHSEAEKDAKKAAKKASKKTVSADVDNIEDLEETPKTTKKSAKKATKTSTKKATKKTNKRKESGQEEEKEQSDQQSLSKQDSLAKRLRAMKPADENDSTVQYQAPIFISDEIDEDSGSDGDYAS